jgi:PAS domain S-box-containing protein
MEPVDERFYEALVRTAGFALIATDPTGNVRFWNDQAARLLGGRSEPWPGAALVDLFPAESRSAFAEHLRRALEAGEVGDLEFSMTGPDGQARTFAAVVSPVVGDDGRTMGAGVAMRDITQRKVLSRQVGKKRKLEALGGMANAVAHHFNNILAGMQTSIDAALRSENPRLVRRTLELVAESIGRATRITNQLLSFAEARHGEGEWVDLNVAVERFVERLRPQAAAAGVDVRAELRPVAPREFESHRLYPVLESLAQNALEAMPSGGRLTVRLSEQDPEAVIVIADTGCGIAPEHLDRLFEPFFTTRGHLGGGTASNVGLGLAAVHGMVAEMGGRISVESQVGVGTTMEIRLPLAPQAEA